jgi:glycine/D-amino acid oxidase-like deaminating enzyme
MLNEMATYDWIVIGAGITGASLAYELSKQFKVLLLEKDLIPDNATVYSYGGLAYWSATDELTRQLAAEGIALHRQLSEELGEDTEFRELDLLLTVDRHDDPKTIAKNYDRFAITPELLNVQEACKLEPLLNPNAIAGCLKLPHGHIHPQKTTDAYLQAMVKNGGRIIYQGAIAFIRQGDKIIGVQTEQETFYSANTVVCAGGLSRSLLQTAGIKIDNYFTHAQVIIAPPIDFELSAIVMPAILQRFDLEATAGESTDDASWDNSRDLAVETVLDAGAIQFIDGSLCLGQISAIAKNSATRLDDTAAETQIRKAIGNILPFLEKVPGTCYQCLVAFNPTTAIALVGNLPNIENLYLFSGFTSTLVYAPIVARHFADWASGNKNKIIEQLQMTMNEE